MSSSPNSNYYLSRKDTTREKRKDYQKRKINEARLEMALNIYRYSQRGFSRQKIIDMYNITLPTYNTFWKMGETEYLRLRGQND